jgi:transcriptional regulator with XRE-family HTH domain
MKDGQRLRARREELGLTMRQAERVWGYSSSLISAVERSQRTLTDGLALAAGIQARARGTSGAWLDRNGFVQTTERAWLRGPIRIVFDGCDWRTTITIELKNKGTQTPASKLTLTAYGATPKSSYHRCRDLVALATGELSTTEDSSVVAGLAPPS